MILSLLESGVAVLQLAINVKHGFHPIRQLIASFCQFRCNLAEKAPLFQPPFFSPMGL